MRGTLLNVVTVLLGTALGVLLGGRLPERVRRTVLDVLGLFVLVLGVANAFDAFGEVLTERVGRAGVLVVLGSVLVGAVIGEVLDLDGALNRLGEVLRRRFAASEAVAGPGGALLDEDAVVPGGSSRFVEGFVVASLVFCVGPLAILGSIADGLSGDYQILAIKSLLDGFAALAFASALGIGVGFSALPILVLQGGITLAAGSFAGLLDEPMIAALNAVGGVAILGIGLRLLELREVRVANLLPGLVIAPVVVGFWP